ncbi:helix-turn-helix domain-containing protein [Aquimarina mytili]|uniref:Helix-turn-helix domain-containing protein n=1 Tax=Aquimarina mytili TaxID=874423 RepID=A0A937DAP2_9FLAO|nr:helix-turn-helix domain-containing protein [Aquimarina mytili]MBL0682931.1 helix-turn-helix domain-containing protein [Aquimarina mytili]
MKPESVIHIRHDDVVDRMIDFEVIKLEDLLNRHEAKYLNLYDWHRMDFNALFIVTEGEGRHHIDCEVHDFKIGAIVPLLKGQIHHFDEENPIKGVTVSFTDTFILENISETNLLLFLKMFHLPKLQISPESLKLLEPVVELLFREQDIRTTVLKGDITRSLLLTLFMYIQRLSPLEFAKSDTVRFKDFIRFKNLVAQKYRTMHNAKDYAKELHLSYKYINDISKEMSGKTAKSFIDEWLIIESKRIISQKIHSIKEMSYEMGFDEPSNFIRFFKKHTGKTPKEFSTKIST